MSHTSIIKLGAALAISLTLASAASAFTVKTTRTEVDEFGNRVTKSRTITDDGVQRCRTFTRITTEASGDRNSRSKRICQPNF